MATRSQKPKRKRDNNSPPKRKPKNVKNSEADCLICDEAILEPGDLTDGDDAVFCEGVCQGWLHRKCAGLSRPVFDKLSESDNPYVCLQCMLHNQAKEITELKSVINALTTEINNLDLKDALTKLQEAVNSLKSPTLEMPTPASVPILSPSKPHASAQKPVLNSLKDSTDTLHDHRYCVVVYGIPENPTGTQ